MKGLLLKDCYMLWKLCKSFLFLVVVFAVMPLFSKDNMFFVAYPVVMAGMLPMTLLSYDEREKWNVYAETLPYTRAQVVSVKYVIGLLLSVGVWVCIALMQAVAFLVRQDFVWEEYVSLLFLIIVLGLFGPAIFLPFAFKIGTERGRLIYYVVLGVAMGGGTALLTAQQFSVLALKGIVPGILIFVISVVMYLFSWGLSIKFYEKREL